MNKISSDASPIKRGRSPQKTTKATAETKQAGGAHRAKGSFTLGISAGWMRFLSAVAAVLLLFAIGFYSVSIVLDDTGFLEAQFTSLETAEKTGIPVPDLSRASKALFEYMRGSRADIRVSVVQNGEQVDDLFYHVKEVVHMEEVRTLWRNLVVLSTLGLLFAAALLVLIGMFGVRKARLRSIGAGLLLGTGLFTVVMLLCVLWAVSDFNSFWTVFHFIIFPSSFLSFVSDGMTMEAYNRLNWVFDADFAMIQILDELFLPLVLRVGIFLGAEIAVTVLAATVIFRKGQRLAPPVTTLVEEKVVENDDPFLSVKDAPDLVLQHQLQNASLRQKKKLMEKLRRAPGKTPEPEIEEPIPTEAQHFEAESGWEKPESEEAGPAVQTETDPKEGDMPSDAEIQEESR